MTGGTLASTLALAAIMALAGVGFGLVYFRALRRTVNLLAGGAGWLWPAMLTLARGANAILLLIFMARLGAMALLACLLGFLLARAIALRSARKAS